MTLRLTDLSDDVLIHLCTFLSIPDILKARQTCRRLDTLLHLSIVWINACEEHILRHEYPFPGHRVSLGSPDEVNGAQLEQLTKRAWRLAAKWRSSNPLLPPRTQKHFTVSPSTPISDIRFLPGQERLVLTVSKGIWSVLTVWDITKSCSTNVELEHGPRRCSSWSPKGGIFTGLAVDESCAALSVAYDSAHQVHLFHISDQGELFLLQTSTLALPMKPLTLAGSLLALCDDMASTVIWNWKTGFYAILEHEQDEEGVWKQDHPIQVVFTYETILVVRARSVHLFPNPGLIETNTGGNIPSSETEYMLESSATEGMDLDFSSSPQKYSPLAKHSFGWVDGVSVSVSDSRHSPLRILVRAESDNPWVDINEHKLDLYVLEPNPSYCSTSISQPTCATNIPYLFPPRPHPYLSVPSTHGSLRCPSVHLGVCSTGVWIRPGSGSSTAGLGVSGRNEVNNGMGLVDPRLWAELSSFSEADSQLAFAAGKTALDLSINGEGEGKVYETLVAAVFPGPLNRLDPFDGTGIQRTHPQLDYTLSGAPVRVATLATNTSSTNSWTALDYDEARGRVGVGCADGGVWVFEL